MTEDSIIITDDYNKHKEISGIHFFITGVACDIEEFCNGYFTRDVAINEKNKICAFVVEGRDVFVVIAENGFIKRARIDYVDAMGSGCEFAFAFMDTGMSAKEAIIATAKRDTNTGGTVHEFNIPV